MTFGWGWRNIARVSDLGLVRFLIVHQPTLGDALDVLTEYRTRINSNLDDCRSKITMMQIFLREHFSLQTASYIRAR